MPETTSKPDVNLGETKVLAAVREMLEDRMGDCITHMKDPTTVEGKPCTITLTVTVTPDRLRQQFFCEVGNKIQLSPRESFGSTVYATEKRDGRVEIVEFNPQMSMEL